MGARLGAARALTGLCRPYGGACASLYGPFQQYQEDNLSHFNPSTGLPVDSRGARTADRPAAQHSFNAEHVFDTVLESVDDSKAEEIVQIDLRGRSDVADYMVICSGRSSRQVGSIAEKLADKLKQTFGVICKIEGKETGDWVLIDSGDVIIHVFRPEVREFYQLEKMWLPASETEA